MAHAESQCSVRSWAATADAPFGEPVFMFDCGSLPADRGQICVVLPSEGVARARELLESGVHEALLGDAALLGGSQLQALAAEFSGKVGVYVPAARMAVSWTIDVESNADFRMMTPSVCEPCWEVLRSDGSRTGVIARWWIEQMLNLGAATVLVAVDIEDDQDLNICAGMAEAFGDRLWIGPLRNPQPDIVALVKFGKASRLAVPYELYRRDSTILALRGITAAAEETA